jgi:hypothetical protein
MTSATKVLRAGTLHFKDAVLDRLATSANVAQFVSYGPDLQQRFSRIFGFPRNHIFASPAEATEVLLSRSSERSVNVRSFEPQDPKSREFVYGLTNVDAVWKAIARLAASGLYTIVNETIDVKDGGVSGVALGNAIELAPGDTPRAVEKPGTASFPRALGTRLLTTVYGFRPALRFPRDVRVEFSVHPLRRGYQRAHTVVWELEKVGVIDVRPVINWPNRFSRFIGDKAFGLLVADALGAPVPDTTVISRHVAPFRFGRATGCAERWIRTCPVVQVPGKFTTQRGWTDPFRLLTAEDPTGTEIASVLSQAGVDAQYSGALLAGAGKGRRRTLVIEGTTGFGDEFMVGRKQTTVLPRAVTGSVRRLYERLAAALGPVRFEWVADGRETWVVQLHRGATESSGKTIYPGRPAEFLHFEVDRGLEALRGLISEMNGKDQGVILVGDVGVTSHFGDVLRKARIPSRIEEI